MSRFRQMAFLLPLISKDDNKVFDEGKFKGKTYQQVCDDKYNINFVLESINKTPKAFGFSLYCKRRFLLWNLNMEDRYAKSIN